jgi:RNA polymerase sigma-70 factor, ECF subfamily
MPPPETFQFMTELLTAPAELARRIHSGDKRAEAELFARFQNGVRQIIWRVTGDFFRAEELAQETLIVALRRLRSGPLEDPTKLPAYVAQTARNLAIAEKRKERRRLTDIDSEALEDVPDGAVSHEGVLHLDTAANTVRKLLTELHPERDRNILVRHYLYDEDKEIICREWGITEPTFHVILFRARKRFLELLKKRGISRTDLFSLVLVL